MPPQRPAVFFDTAAAFRLWLTKHHLTESEVVVGFYKKDSGRTGITYAEALDEALCFGWIDGIRRSIDATSYSSRFTPRKSSSNWSLINITHVERLSRAGRMMPAGIAAFESREEHWTGVYSFEQKQDATLTPAMQREFRAAKPAWSFFAAQPPGYRRTAIFWVMSAKREGTRARRLAQLIDDSAHARRIRLLA